MAEITSALPTCGGPFYWASVLAREHGKLVGWITGELASWSAALGLVHLCAATGRCSCSIRNTCCADVADTKSICICSVLAERITSLQ